MTQLNFTPQNKLIVGGEPAIVDECHIEAATNMYPGRLVKRGTTDDDIVVNTAGNTPTGVLLFEDTQILQRPASGLITGIYLVDARAKVGRGGDFVFLATLAQSQTIVKGDPLVAAAAGMVSKAAAMAGLAATGSATASAVDATRPTVAVTGSTPASGVIIGYAEETITSTSNEPFIKVRFAL